MISSSTKHISTLYLTILVLVTIIMIQRGCNNTTEDSKIVTVVVPEKTGVFDDFNLDEIKIPSAPKIIIYNNKEVIVDSNVNDSLAIEYLKAKDSVTKLNLYLNSITSREYSKVLNDSNVEIKVNAVTTGVLDKMNINYTIKEKIVKIPVRDKKTVFALYGGVGLKNTVVLDQFATTANLGFQNKKGDILTVQYGSDKSIQLNYSIKIFDIKK